MRACVVAVGVVGSMACRRPVVDDCTIVRDDPTHAVAEIGKRYPDDPVKRATVIERCVAPEGDDCDRVAKIAKAIPAMMPGGVGSAGAGGTIMGNSAAPRSNRVPAAGAAGTGSAAVTPGNGAASTGRAAGSPAIGTSGAAIDYRAVCLRAPAELRPCLLPSYQLGHAAECQEVLAEILRRPIEITPAARGVHVDDCEGSEIAVYVTADGIWLGTGPESRCFEPRHDGALGTDWLEVELRPFAALECRPAVELASAAGVHYQDVIATMDVAVKVGLIDVGLSAPDDLAVSFATADARRAAHHCPLTTVPYTAKPTDGPPSSVLAPSKDALRDAPVVIITRTDVVTRGQRIGQVAELARGTGKIQKLDQALPHPPAGPLIILQADESTDMAVIVRVVETMKAAGYPNVLFAVKNK